MCIRDSASRAGAFIHWFEHLEGETETLLTTEAGQPALVGSGRLRYLAGWPDYPGWDHVIALTAKDAGLETVSLPEGLRIRDTASHRFLFNHGSKTVEWQGEDIPAAGVRWWKRDPA